MPTVAELDVKINADDDATGTIARLDALIRGLDGDDVDVDVDVDTGEAESDIAHLIAEINSISDETVNIDTDIDGALGDIAKLEAELKAIPDEKVTIETDVDNKGIVRGTKNLKKFSDTSLNASRQVSFLAAAVLGLGTALIPIGAVAVGGVVALGSAFVAAGVGLGLFAAAAATTFGPVNDALQKMHQYQEAFNQAVTDDQRDKIMAKMAALMGSLSAEERDMVIAVENFRGAWGRMVETIQPQMFLMATEGLQGLQKILPSLQPWLEGTANALLFLERAGVRALQGSFWRSFLDMMGNEAGPLIRKFGLSIGNIITGFAALIMAFMPLTTDFSTGLLRMTKAFSNWAKNLSQSKGFQDFVAYIRENTPLVLDLIRDFAGAFVSLVKAGAPLGEMLLKAASRTFEFIQALEDSHPAALTAALAIIGIMTVVLNLVGPIMLVLKFVGLLMTGFGALGTVVGAVAGFLGIGVGAFLAIVAAIAAVVFGVMYAYKHFETFRDIVNKVAKAVMEFGKNAYDAIVEWLGQAGDWLSSTFGPAVQAVIDFVVQQFNKVRDWASENAGTFEHAWSNIWSVVSRIMIILKDEITGALNQISAVWNFFWPTLSAVLQGVWTAIKGIVSGALDIIMGVILIFAGLFSGEWGKMWEGVVQVLTGFWEIIKGVFQGGFQELQALVHLYLEIVRSIWSAAWGLIVAGLSAAWSTIVSIVKASWGVVVSAFRTFQSTVQAGVNGFWSAVIAIFRGAWNLVTSGLRAAWNTAASLTSSAWNGIKNVVTDAAGRVVSAVRTKISDAVNYIRDFGPRALGVLSGLGGRFYNAGASLLHDLASGISAGIGDAVGAMRDAVGKLTDLLPGSPAKTGPLSGQGYSLIRGRHLAEDLAAGIRSRSRVVMEAAREAAVAASTGLSAGDAAAAAARKAATKARDADPVGSFGDFGGGGITINLASGSIVLHLETGVDPKAARKAFDGAGNTLVDALIAAIHRRQG